MIYDCRFTIVAKTILLSLNPAVETANHAKYANRKKAWKKRPFSQRVNEFGSEKDQVALLFSRGSRISQFIPTAVSRLTDEICVTPRHVQKRC